MSVCSSYVSVYLRVISLSFYLSHTQARRVIERVTKKGIEIEWKKKLTDMNGLSARAGQRARRKHAISWRTTMKYPSLLVYLILRLSLSLTRPTAHRCYFLSLSALPQSLLHVISVNVRRRHSPFGRRQWLAVYLIKTLGMNTHLWNHLCFCFGKVPFIFWSDLCNLSNKRVYPHKTEKERNCSVYLLSLLFLSLFLSVLLMSSFPTHPSGFPPNSLSSTCVDTVLDWKTCVSSSKLSRRSEIN